MGSTMSRCNMSLKVARSLVGTKTRGGVEFLAVLYAWVREGKPEKVLGLEALCPCGKVWTVTNAPSAYHPTRSCDDCRKKRMRVHFALSAREEGWAR